MSSQTPGGPFHASNGGYPGAASEEGRGLELNRDDEGCQPNYWDHVVDTWVGVKSGTEDLNGESGVKHISTIECGYSPCS